MELCVRCPADGKIIAYNLHYVEKMWNLFSPGIEIFSNSVARWQSAPPNFLNLVTFETTWQKRSLNPDVNLVKFYSIFQCIKKIFPGQTQLTLFFEMEFSNIVFIAFFITQGCGAGAKHFRCLKTEPDPKIWVSAPQPCSSSVNTGWLAPPTPPACSF